ncbi:MAG: hypothetical protein C0469_03015 [Cyanobacteria bacterium DS2.3.42]|nr:hypothetical protein [Cyanobacteria bacterium DS2.3.42]
MSGSLEFQRVKPSLFRAPIAVEVIVKATGPYSLLIPVSFSADSDAAKTGPISKNAIVIRQSRAPIGNELCFVKIIMDFLYTRATGAKWPKTALYHEDQYELSQTKAWH